MAAEDTTRLYVDAREGAPGAMDALCRRCAAKLLPLIRLRMGRALRAELDSRDILQSVLMKAFQKLPDVKEPAALMGWLSAIAANEIRDRADYLQRDRRDAIRRAPLEDAAAVPAPVRHALSLAIVHEQLELLERGLESLPEAQREIIVLRKLEERSFAEIGRQLGKSEDACRMMFARAMAALTLAVRDGH